MILVRFMNLKFLRWTRRNWQEFQIHRTSAAEKGHHACIKPSGCVA
jgi:hypothetical protein